MESLVKLSPFDHTPLTLKMSILKSHLRDTDEIAKFLGDKNLRFANKRILLTGAAGFLGSQFVHFFARLNETILVQNPCLLVAMDNFLRGIPSWLKEFEGRKDIIIQKADIIFERQFEPADFIIHAASIASPIFYRKHPIETMDANVIGLRNLLEHSRNAQPESFLFFSSSEIYGDPDSVNIPTKEDYRGSVSCTGPRACYDESKRYGETLCVSFSQVYGTPVKIVRPFNNYGPGLKITDRRVLPDFFRDALAGRNIELLSDGRATRTFCYISDAITGYLLALLSSYNGESFNIGADKPEISMEELAVLVIATTGSKIEIDKRQSIDPQYLIDNPQRRCPDLSKARHMLGYSPQIDLEEGLVRMFEYYKESPDGSNE
jgi:UDP-glucuronate decarboxylase